MLDAGNRRPRFATTNNAIDEATLSTEDKHTEHTAGLRPDHVDDLPAADALPAETVLGIPSSFVYPKTDNDKAPALLHSGVADTGKSRSRLSPRMH